MSAVKLLIAVSSLVSITGITALGQTPTPSPSPRECDIPAVAHPDKRVKILAKPEAKFRRSDRERYYGRALTLRATFCGTGKVTDIVVTEGLNKNMDAAAIDAARLIKFTPAEKDGNKASQVLIVLYYVH